MNTKFDIGQEVWFMANNKPQKGAVSSIVVKEENKVFYIIGNSGSKEEELVSDSQVGLRDIVFQDLLGKDRTEEIIQYIKSNQVNNNSDLPSLLLGNVSEVILMLSGDEVPWESLVFDKEEE